MYPNILIYQGLAMLPSVA